MPTGFNAMVALNTFLAVLIVGTAWRLIAFHLMTSPNSSTQNIGRAMSFQY